MTEREDKFDVGPKFAVPDLADLSPQRRVTCVTERLTSTYFDTVDHDLLGHRLTLRRREGTSDTGWQLKVPAGRARTEIRLPPNGSTTVPAELVNLLTGVRAGQELHPVAIVKVQRVAYRVMAGSDILVEVADDDVHATALGADAVVQRWREVEAELGTGDEELLAAIGERLRTAGATPSRGPSKLARALGNPEPAPAPDAATAGGTAMAYLRAQHDVLILGDLALRRGDFPIHATRVAVRRFRSVLRTFAPVFVAHDAEALDGELAWYGQLLGEVRDREVQRAHFATELAAIPADLLLGPVAARIEQHLLGEQLRRQQILCAALSGERYVALVRALDEWLRHPKLTGAAARPAKSLLALVERADHKATKRLRRAVGPDGDAAALHRARKAAKRARYATEAAADVPARKAARKRLATRRKTLKKRQDVLGEHHDSVEAASLMRVLGIAAGSTSGENGFTYGLLFARECARGARARAAAAKHEARGVAWVITGQEQLR